MALGADLFDGDIAVSVVAQGVEPGGDEVDGGAVVGVLLEGGGDDGLSPGGRIRG